MSEYADDMGADMLRERLEAVTAERDQARADRRECALALRESEDALLDLVPGNSYGLLDHSADKERSAALVIVRAALARPGVVAALEKK